MAETGTLPASITALSLSDTATPAADHTQPPKTNLPLPRELRDKIWGYLLYHEHVHTAPYSDWPDNKKGEESEKYDRSISRAHTFTFHINVLAVNRQIYEECLKVLKSNDFIVVTYEGPLRGTAKHIVSLPIITESLADCASFEHHTLSVHFKGALDIYKEADGAHAKGSFVMVAAELPRFCHMLQNVLYHVPAIATYVCEGQDTHPLCQIKFAAAPPDGPDDKPLDLNIYTKIHFNGNDIHADQARKSLSAFYCVVHANQHISVINCPKGLEQDLTKLREVMAPKAVWLKAMAWHILEYCQWELAEAKNAAEAGDLEHAIERFSGVMRLVNQPFLFNLPANEVYVSEAALPIALLALTLLDAGVTEILLCIRLAGAGAERRDVMSDPLEFLCRFLIKRLPRKVFEAALAMLGFELRGEPPPEVQRVFWYGWMMDCTESNLDGVVRSFDEGSEMLQGDAYFDHDYALVKKLAEDKDFRSKTLSHDNGPTPALFELVAAVQLPVQVYVNPLFQAVKQPHGIEGFTDVAHREQIQQKHPGEYDDL